VETQKKDNVSFYRCLLLEGKLVMTIRIFQPPPTQIKLTLIMYIYIYMCISIKGKMPGYSESDNMIHVALGQNFYRVL
jgi:hypothetical protein